MPRFGLKCFLGSFAFSLAAVFAATEAYFMLVGKDLAPAENEYAYAQENNDAIKNIELFAQAETDPIMQKYASLSNRDMINEISAEPIDADVQNDMEQSVQEISQEPESQDDALYDNIDDTLSVGVKQKHETDEEILYQPDEPQEESKEIVLTQNQQGDETFFADGAENLDEQDMVENQSAEESELIIADASLAQSFEIPLKHNFSNQKETVGVSSSAKENQIAMASQNVKLDNLGTQNYAAVTSEVSPDADNSAWDVAEVANKHITKNKIKEFNDEHKAEIAILNKESSEPAEPEKETKVAYKMVKNILIPIPDEIANDENLTPQLSYSAENKKLDEKLRKQRTRIEGTKNNAQQNKVENKVGNKKTPEENKTLTESITAWFAADKDAKEAESKKAAENNADKNKNHTSSFRKLLGKDKEGNNTTTSIVPMELKLAFQPNRAEISGQTLEWLHAFSENANSDEDVKIEIRIDGSNSYELQQKRLNLLYTIFANNGVDYNKINIIFTAREPNSFIIRNVRYLPDGTERVIKPVIDDKRETADNPWF